MLPLIAILLSLDAAYTQVLCKYTTVEVVDPEKVKIPPERYF